MTPNLRQGLSNPQGVTRFTDRGPSSKIVPAGIFVKCKQLKADELESNKIIDAVVSSVEGVETEVLVTDLQ